MLLMFGEVYQFQKFWLHIFHHAATSEYVDISYTGPFSNITTYVHPEKE
jgi:hypothetical protein